jgi:predicted PurR-regulated permease PerM
VSETLGERPDERAPGDPAPPAGATDHATAEQRLEDVEQATPNLGDVVGATQLPAWFWRAILGIAFAVAAFVLLRGMVEKLTGLLTLIGISLFLAFAVEPAVNWLASRGWRRGPATLVCFFVIFGIGGLFAGLMVSLVVDQVSDLVAQAPEYLADATRWVNDTFGTEITSDQLDQTFADYQRDLTALATDMGGRVLTLTGTAVAVIFQMFTVFLFSYYMISQGPKLRRNACSLLPPQRQQVVLRLWELAVEKTGGWVYSRLLLAAISGLTSWVVFVIIGLPSPLALALWLGLTSQFIPVVGTYLGGVLPLVLALISRPIDALWVLAWIVIYQQIENYLLAPRITAHTMDLHPAVAFGSALAGASLLGPMGAVLALPAAAVIQAFVSTYLERHEVVESELTRLDP